AAGSELRSIPLCVRAVTGKARGCDQPPASAAAQPYSPGDATDLDDRIPGWRRNRNGTARDRDLAVVRAPGDEKSPRPREGHPAARPRAYRGRGLPDHSAPEPAAAEDRDS